MSITISGKIVRQSNQNPIPGLYVELWDKSNARKDVLGSTITDSQGMFVFQFDESYTGELYKDRYPDTYFKVFAGNTLLSNTESFMVVNLQGNTSDLVIPVDYALPPNTNTPQNKYIVRGVLLQSNYTPAAGYAVEVRDKGLINDTILATVPTNAQGLFETTFSSDIFLKAGKQSPDIFLRITLNRQVVHTTQVVYNAPPILEFKEVIGGALFPKVAEFDLLSRKLQPLLRSVALQEVKQEAANNPYLLLAQKTGANEQQMKWYVTSFQLANLTQLPAPFFYAVLRGQLAPEYSVSPSDLIGKNIELIIALIKALQDNKDVSESFVGRSQQPEALLHALANLPEGAVPGAFDFAIRNNIIPAQLQAQREALLKQWSAIAARYRDNQRTKQRPLLDKTSLKKEEKKTVTDLLEQHAHNVHQLFASLDKNEALNKEQVDEIKTTVVLNQLLNDPEAAVAVQAKLKLQQPAQLSQLARLTEKEWQDLIGKKTATQEWSKDRIQQLQASLEHQFPTASFATKLKADEKPGLSAKDSLVQFFETFPGLELHQTQLDQFFQKNSRTISEKFKESDTLKTELKKVQRVFKLAPNYATTKALLRHNIHSSQSVYNLGRNRFIETVSDSIPKEEAEKIYKKAERSYAATLAIIGELKSLENGSALKVLPNIFPAEGPTPMAAMTSLPNLKTLFTSPDICECSDCRNVYSAAAYLADLLKFLDKRGSTTPMQSVKKVLFKRRPDIGEIDLNCDNTNTPIPYIDLVTETLENVLLNPPVIISGAVEPLLTEGLIHANVFAEFQAKNLEVTNNAAVTLGIAGTWFVRDALHTYKIVKSGGQLQVSLVKQTHGTAAERKALPEYINYPVYDTILKNEKHPFELPFDLSWEEARAYLDKIGISRWEWMEAFQNKSVPAPTDVQIAAEFIGISPAEKTIITTVDPGSQNIFWGGLVNIDKVSVFLQKSGLEYVQLLDLLEVKFINPTFDSKVVHHDPTCDTETKTISNLDNNKLDRINRFLRLWRKTNWNMWEVDKAIMNPQIGNGQVDDNFLIHLKSFISLTTALNLSVEQVIAYYEELNTKGDVSLYNKLFRNKVILNPLPDAFKVELVTESPFPSPTPPAPDGTIRTITAQLKSLAAVLKLKPEEAAEIQAKSLANDDLSLANISLFYRIASLTRKLRLSTSDYYLLLELLNTGAAFNVFAHPAATNDFLQIVALVRSSGFKPFELAYMLLHKDVGAKPLIPTDEGIKTFIEKGREALQKVQDDLNGITGLADEIAKTLIGKITSIDEDATNETVQIFNGTFTGTTVARDAFLDATFGPFIATATLKTKLNDRDAALPAQKDQKTKEAYEELNKLLIAYLKTTQGKEAIYTLHAEAFKFSDDVSRLLLDQAHLQGTTDALMTYWLDANLLAKDSSGNYLNAINNVNFPNLFKSYQLLNKIALLQAKMPLSTEVLQVLINHAGDFGVLSFDDLPVGSGVVNSHFAAWQNYVRLYQFSQLYPDNDTGTLAGVLQKLVPVPDTEANFLQALTSYTLWDLNELTAIKTQLGWVYPADYKQMKNYVQLDRVFNLLTTPAIKAAQVPLLINPTPVAADAISIKQLVKSKYDNDQWLNTSANIQEGIRLKKRDALVAYFTHNVINGNTFTDANALYSYYLLDTEMGAKEVTTRILQANLSIQLFVQRCLMSLEAEVVADAATDDGWNQWQWMKYYQVWAANRKVFLYPENWIEPELRLDKSPFFEDLENDLSQNEVTKTNVEDAFLRYLEKLDNVARLDVSGFYYEEETYTLHVFARTYDDPNIYYYRKWVEDRYWTAWEKLDLEINTTHVIPVVINRRLYLYWPEFREQSQQSSSTDAPNPGQKSFPIDQPYKYWEIHLAVSEFRNNKWTPKKISKTSITTSTSKDPLIAKELFSFIPIDLIDIADKYLMGCYVNATPNDATNFNTNPVDFFDLGSCHGTPEVLTDYTVRSLIKLPIIPQFERSELEFLESQETTTYPNDVLAYQQGNLFINHVPILRNTPGIFRTPQPAQLGFFDKLLLKIYWMYFQAHPANFREFSFPHPVGTFLPFFYEDKGCTFFVPQEFILFKRRPNDPNNPLIGEFFYSDIIKIIQEIQRTGKLPDILKPYFEDGQWPGVAYRLKFSNFYHPYVCFLIKQLYIHGIDGLMKREVQLLDTTKFPEIKPFDFLATYAPTWVVNPIDSRIKPNPLDPDTLVTPGYPKETMDFNAWGSYAEYNWELFYHAPMLVAERLSSNQQFEDAMHWYHYIFNPTDASAYPSPQRFWNTKPFFQRATPDYVNQRIDQILTMINSGDTELIKDVDDWRRNAFQPHLVAQFRTLAYQKTTVMKYLDNLINWGDNLFRTDTRENINAATQLYILAAEILGPKPKRIPNFLEPPVLNYNQLEPKLDAFANALIEVENFLPYFSGDVQQYDTGGGPLPTIELFYFCIPQNDKLLTYWDTIADRLFKIRHSMNIDGIERQLALFDPPIDPGLLVKAVASGISIGAAIAGLNAPLPFYRFQTLSQKANEFSTEVKTLGAALLSALEKRDAEAMALLRSTHEIRLLEAVKLVRKTQVEEAKANVEALNKTKAVTQEKLNYYASREYMNPEETVAFALSTASTALDVVVAAGYILAGGLTVIPQFIAGGSGFGGSPHVTVDIGGVQFSGVADYATKAISAVVQALDKGASLASTQGSYKRRSDDWDFQVRTATKEIAQIDQQIVASQIRLDITQKELDNQQLQIDNAKEESQFMRSKYTSQQLYEWMIGQISGVYFQSYQLAFDMAKRAEKCFRYELGIADTSFIQFGYWDSLKKGLLSGEKLSLDIKRMEASYFDKNKREFELVKHVSLNQIDPLALLKLKQNGVCFLNLPEEVYDLDYPGHYFRRIKSVAVTIPCIIGPYNNVNCTLTILKSRIRVSANTANVDYSTPPTESDPGFTFNFSSIQQIATSNGQNDNGLFESNLRDERYLPFEGHGAISEWKLELNPDFKNFDFNTISDVILHVRYTARQGGNLLAAKVKTELKNHFDQIIKTYEDGTGFFKLFSLKSDFSAEFHQLLNPPGATQQVNIGITQSHVPYWLSGKTLDIDNTVPVVVWIKVKSGQVVNLATLNMQINAQAVSFSPPVVLGELKQGSTNQSGPLLGTWSIASTTKALDPAKIDDILILVKYTIS